MIVRSMSEIENPDKSGAFPEREGKGRDVSAKRDGERELPARGVRHPCRTPVCFRSCQQFLCNCVAVIVREDMNFFYLQMFE